jgi:hypothetical protein
MLILNTALFFKINNLFSAKLLVAKNKKGRPFPAARVALIKRLVYVNGRIGRTLWHY